MDLASAAALMATIRVMHPKLPKSDDAVSVWALALDGCDEAAAADAVMTLLRESHRQPTPADIIRVMRETRARLHPEVKPDPREIIPLNEAAASILAELTARMRADGRIPPASRERA